MRCLIALLAGAAAGLGPAPHAETLLVRPDGAGDYPTIQAAVDAVVDGDVILLGSGVFRGEGNRDVRVMGLDVIITSESGDPRDVVIDCEGTAGDPHRAMQVCGLDAVIHGISMIHGDAGVGAGGGGAMQIWGTVTVSNCIFAWNSAMAGGALTTGQASTAITGCTFYANTATYADEGAAVFQGDIGELQLDHCIFAFGGGGAAIASWSSSVELLCCDVYGNEGGDYVGVIEGQLGVNGNISVDPLFCASPFMDLRLDSNSPCASGGDCGLIGALPVGCGPTPASESSWGAIKALYRGE